MDLLEFELRRGADVPRHPWERARLAVVRRLLERPLAFAASQPERVLDVGCGDAWLVTELARRCRHLKFHGVDPALGAGLIAELTDRAAGVDLALSRELPTDNTPRVRVLLLLDVIEHVDDDIGLVRQVCSLPAVDDKSIVLVTVPAFPAVFGSQDRLLRHHRRYTATSLRRTMSAAGLEIHECGYFFTSLLLARAVEVAAERLGIRGAPKGVSGWRYGERMAKLVAGTLLLDYTIAHQIERVARIRVPGLSCYAICAPASS